MEVGALNLDTEIGKHSLLIERGQEHSLGDD